MPESFLRELLPGRRVAVAESCTGGLLSQALAAMTGSGDWFRGGLVAYQSDVKFDLLDVPPGPVVSATACAAMAEGAGRLFDADTTVAITGVAGPDPQDGVLPGHVFIATRVGRRDDVRAYRFSGSPAEVCKQARNQALQDLTSALAVVTS